MQDHRQQTGVVPEHLWTIREMALHYDITLRALRFYEDKGLIASIRQGMTRLYDQRTRARLEVVLKGKHLGFTLSEVRDLLEVSDQDTGPAYQLALDDAIIVEQIEMLKRQRDSIEKAIDELRQTQSRRMDPPVIRAPEVVG